MKVEGLTITCENNTELIAIADAMGRLFADMNKNNRGGDYYNLSYRLMNQLEEHIEKEKLT